MTGWQRLGMIGMLCSLALLVACESVPTTPEKAKVVPTLPGIGSILVLPPIDESLETDADRAYLPTITRPLVRRGYYVFPVAVVDRILRENGLPDSASMHAISLDRINAFFKPDAVLYVTVSSWGSSYKVLASVTTVKLTARLVNAQTGEEIWSGQGRASESSGGHEGSLAELLVSALARQVRESISDQDSVNVARAANRNMLYDRKKGLPYGPYHPAVIKQLEGRAQQ